MADSDQQIVSLIIDRLRIGCGRLAVRTLELRMEISKRLANVEDEFVKRLHDRCPVSEQYLNSDIHLHIQGRRFPTFPPSARNGVLRPPSDIRGDPDG
jgi:hypothetical protein